MNEPAARRDGRPQRRSRRSVLALGASAIAGLAGCLDLIRSMVGGGSDDAERPATDRNDGDDVGSPVGDVHAALTEGRVVALARERDAPIAIDPEATRTPIQDGLDLLGAGGGELRLPPKPVSEAESIRPYDDAAIVGFGPAVTEVNLPPNTDGILFDRDPGVSRVKLDGFGLNGPGPDAESGAAIRHSGGDTQDLYVGRMVFWGWNNAVYRVDQGTGPFQCRHDLLTIYECDAGDENGLFEFGSSYGPANWFGTIAAYPTAQYSGRDSTVFYSRGGTQTVDYLTMGGTSGVAIHQARDAHIRFGNVHWEPVDLVDTPERVVLLEGDASAHIGSVKHVTGVADYVYELAYDAYNARRPGRKWLGPYTERGAGASLAGNVVNVAAATDPDAPSFYLGSSDDVDVTHSETSPSGLTVLSESHRG